ncbi:MAG: HIT family hydrolase [Elusimicrobia bacterium CG08_land_8_20_14_0_20_44_26]|nr:MAG: HIT family hydrolase [Elusimicrobia bacterium CG08_land_8_20_14_0_20_44_26]
MKYLYAPWRDSYFDVKDKTCIFCRAAKGKKDAERFVLYRGKLAFAMLNLFPYTNAHVLIAPYRHEGDLRKLSCEEIGEIMELVKKTMCAFSKEFGCKGFNIGVNQGSVAGAGFASHIHFHVVGRWTGDTNFMTVVSDARVSPSSPVELYRKLKKYFNSV